MLKTTFLFTRYPFSFFLLLLGSLFITVKSTAAPAPHSGGSPFDLAIANEDKLIEMFKASGTIPADASLREAEEALRTILFERQKAALTLSTQASESPLADVSNKVNAKGYHSPPWGHKGKGHGRGRWGNRPLPVEEESWEGEVFTAKVLTILIEFPDFPHNNISPADTENYYPDYNPAHYEAVLFQRGGYSGPNGENFITVRDYYEAQSGGSYSLSGAVAGWYMASQAAAFYGASGAGGTGNDANPQALVAEALLAAEADPNVDLSQFDQEDRYDLDGDGNYWEPDGLVDHIQIVHSAVGEESGGGALGSDAIWSHRWNLGDILVFGSVPAKVDYWDGLMGAYDYTIQSIDAGAGVIAHEYAHDLGLPDEYDTLYSGRGEPVSFWSLMASGTWAGLIPGSQPTGFSPWAKEFLQNSLGGNWLTGTTVHVDDLNHRGEHFLLDQASSKGTNNDVVRVDLPDKQTILAPPVSGEWVYHSGSGDDLSHFMLAVVDLPAANSASLQFKAWYDIEEHWDYAYVLINGVPIAGNITTNDSPNEANIGNGITGYSSGWVDAEFDLSTYAGTQVQIVILYLTDAFVSNPGLYLDDISVIADGTQILFDNADNDPVFTLSGFVQDPGYVLSPHYYLMEWRTHKGIDVGLKHIRVGEQLMEYNNGLVIWYVDDYFSENWVGLHPGEGFLGVVDADQRALYWSDGTVASTRYQIHDAAFSRRPSSFLSLTIEDPDLGEIDLLDYFIWPINYFKDSRDYSTPELPDAGRLLTSYGLKAEVVADSWDGSVGKIELSKKSWKQYW